MPTGYVTPFPEALRPGSPRDSHVVDLDRDPFIRQPVKQLQGQRTSGTGCFAVSCVAALQLMLNSIPPPRCFRHVLFRPGVKTAEKKGGKFGGASGIMHRHLELVLPVIVERLVVEQLLDCALIRRREGGYWYCGLRWPEVTGTTDAERAVSERPLPA